MFDMFLWTLQILFGILICFVVTALPCGFLNITRQTNGGILDLKIIFLEQKEHFMCNGSLVSENIRRSSKINN